jgi:hypothetical protein
MQLLIGPCFERGTDGQNKLKRLLRHKELLEGMLDSAQSPQMINAILGQLVHLIDTLDKVGMATRLYAAEVPDILIDIPGEGQAQ